jgi:D-aminopeptidase
MNCSFDSATGGPVLEGNFGAGTGMITYGFAGGIGTSSRRLTPEQGGYTLGILVLANFGRRGELLIAGIPVGHELERLRQHQSTMTELPGEQREQGSVIVLLATDAPLDARQLGRLTRRVPLGLARTGTHGGHGSGDLAIVFSTAHRIPHDSTPLTHAVTVLNEQHIALDALFAAVVETTEEAVLNALFAVQSIDGRDGHRVDALPVHEAIPILQQWRRGR